ncbi:hypothetical protein EVAR_84363_1 [Eumeta japonica]|uniref:Uncharacterized protein n=1 Tax=Eumeta variegata TaxID=151549 RepID=A0A4C1U4Q3_EUMVA|nr:hypothetical protein EVAR_84363_1 [Eumeta japonica]
MALFLHAQSASFHHAVLKVEGQTVSAIEAAKEINHLKDNLAQKQINQFLPFTVRNLIEKLKDNGTNIDEDFVKNTATEFYKTSREYLEQWTCFLTKEMNIFHWADLRKVPAWEDIQKALDVLIQKGYIHCNKDTEVFDEFTLISSASARTLSRRSRRRRRRVGDDGRQQDPTRTKLKWKAKPLKWKKYYGKGQEIEIGIENVSRSRPENESEDDIEILSGSGIEIESRTGIEIEKDIGVTVDSVRGPYKW